MSNYISLPLLFCKGRKYIYIYIHSRFIIKIPGTGGMWITLLRIYLTLGSLITELFLSVNKKNVSLRLTGKYNYI